MHRFFIQSAACALLAAPALAAVDIIDQQAGINVNAIADGESSSVTRNITANDALPYHENRVSANVDETVRAEADAAMFDYAANDANGLSLTSSGAFDVSAEAAGASSEARGIGISGFSIRFELENPSFYSAVGSLFKQNYALLGEDESLVYARLEQVNTVNSSTDTLWEIFADTGATPVNVVNQVLDGHSQYILTVQAYGWVQAVAPDVLSKDNNGSFEIDFELTEATEGDADLNGVVDIEDLGLLAGNYGQGDRLWSHGDFDQDGDVDLVDLTMLATNYSTGGTAQAFADFQTLASVPEPAGATLLLTASLVACQRHRRATCL